MTECFSAGWLALREPYDAAARSSLVMARLADWRAGRKCLRVSDLGAGAGSNLRYAAAILGGAQDWTLVERDPALIAAGRERLVQTQVEWRYRTLDLAADLEQLGEQPVDLITASALIDLVSEPWLRRLAAWRGAAGAALHIVLTFDGRIEWLPSDDGDDGVRQLVNAHQHGDKGFGAALGPDAVSVLRSLLSGQGGELVVDSSDWVLGADDRAIQSALLEGYEETAKLVAPAASDELSAWAARRRSAIDQGQSRLRVGHQDLLFLPDR